MTRRPGTLAAATTLATALTLLAGCGDEGPRTLQPATGDPAADAHRVQCRLTADSGDVTFAFDLPQGFEEGLPDSYHLDAQGCSWHRQVEVVDEGTDGSDPMDRHDSDVLVSVYRSPASLREVEKDAQGDAVSGDVPEGDDSNLHLDYAEGVTTYGATVGDQFRYLCFCDGQDNRHWYAQADGIRMDWEGEDELREEVEAQFGAALASAGTTD